jgi:hypothetical protein
MRIANGDSDILHELRCPNCGSKWSCVCGSMALHRDSSDLNRCPLCSATCAHCQQERVTGRWSELCADCVAVVRRERPYSDGNNEPDDAHDWGIPDPWIGRR